MPRAAVLTLAALLLLAGDGLAEEALDAPVDEDFPLHWGFANSFGTGWYTVGGQQAFILKITPRLPLGNFLENASRDLTLPVTVGFYEFELSRDLLEDLDDKFGTFSFVPGLEAMFAVSGFFRMSAYVEAGHGWEFRGEDHAWIYSAGVKSYLDFDWGKSLVTFASAIDYHGYTPQKGDRHDFSRLSAGLDLRTPLGISLEDHELFLNPHFLYRWYFKAARGDLVDIAYEFELGLALGFRELRLPLIGGLADRVGVAYRLSDNRNFRGIRLYLWFPL